MQPFSKICFALQKGQNFYLRKGYRYSLDYCLTVTQGSLGVGDGRKLMTIPFVTTIFTLVKST